MEREMTDANGGGNNEVSQVGNSATRLKSAARLLGVIVIALLAGMSGPSIERQVRKVLFPGIEQMPEEKIDPVSEALSGDDETIVGIVERSSGAVVSVVASKEVSNIGSLGDLPFFFGRLGIGSGRNGSPDGNGDRGSVQKRAVASGTGFFVSSDGLVVTNKHVVEDDSAEYTVVVSGGNEYPAKVLAKSPTKDIAVLRIGGAGFTALPLGDSSKLKVGQTAIAIGNPLGEFPNSVSRGIISGLNRDVTAGSGYGLGEETLSDIIQTDAAINPGNSGGPLLDLSGSVIGINVAVAANAENIGFAIPIDQVKQVIEEVKATGRISVPYLGVRYAAIDESVARENGLPYSYGAIVVRGTKASDLAVIPGSPADKAGIVENDIILEIDGTRIDSDHTVGDMVAGHRVGDTVTLKIFHKGETKDVSVAFSERPQ
ncbi:MAG: PDZ domain-containing protein [Candidatus Moranbacteria bacterium]|nr:PDZ domain-containing protein [Candidatus Moranbacteria bacterium]